MFTKTIKTALVFLLLLSIGCAVSVDTTTLDFGSDETTKTLALAVQGPITWSITCSETWVTVEPDSNQGEGTYSIDVTVDRTGLNPDNYEATLTISTNTGSPCPDVVVKMSVSDIPPPPVPSEVTGYVYNIVTGDTISGVSVSIDTKSTLTNSEGYYSISPASKGLHTITALKEDYAVYISAIEVTDNFTEHDIYMTPETENLPRVAGAISTGNIQVKVSFSKPMNDDAVKQENYSIVQENPGTNDSQLIVSGARFLDSTHTVVELTTMSQNEVLYRLTAVSMRDMWGNPLAPKEAVGGVLVDPSSATFVGTPPYEDQLVDRDGDGLSDNVEQQGWDIVVVLNNGEKSPRHVTSDPYRTDTDGDGVPDGDEKAYGTDPRSADTDGDQLTDYQELNDIYSDPTMQDTDGDTLMDGLEFNFFKTSPVIADTDGDQFRDNVELIDLDRNPLIADLPRFQIIAGESRLSLEISSSYTDETGETQTTEESLQTSLGKSKERGFGTSDTVSNETIIEYGETVGVEVSYSMADGWGAKGSFESSFGQTYANGFTSAVNRESAEVSSQEYQTSVSHAFSQSENRSVTRTINNAEIAADVSIQNLGNIAFTITNLELSVLQQDRRVTGKFIPIAALRLSGVDDPTDQPLINLGPFDPERGPFIFKSTDAYPNLVEDLLHEPHGIVYRVVNYDILDEFGRNLVFISQDVSDRTVGITIDFGGGDVESYRIATHNCFDANGQMLPITMQHALEVAGITKSTDPSGDTPNADPDNPEILSTYGTQRDSADGVELLTRVRGIQMDFSSESPEKQFWAVISNEREVPETEDFSSIKLRARDNFLLAFTRDSDQDGLMEREEKFYGSSDKDVDTDGDSISDYDEIRKGWSVALKGTDEVKVFSSPASSDTDGDGLTDDLEMQFGTDPTKQDTDFDGFSDVIEILGPINIFLYDGDDDEWNNPLLIVEPYEGPPAIVNAFDGICDTSAAGDDVQEVEVGVYAEDGEVVVSAGPNGLIDTEPGGDDYERVAHDQEYATDPLNRDTDFDSVSDGRELFLGINPNRNDAGSVLDSDDDGLTDDEEEKGWYIRGTTNVVTSNKLIADTDRDGIPDVYERAIGTDPNKKDTDGDTLLDYREFDPDDPTGIYDVLALANAADLCNDASACFYNKPSSPAPTGTDPSKKDTDADGLDDYFELHNETTIVVNNQNVKLPSAGATYYSNPTDDDTDGDGWNDGKEWDEKTDPQNPDTDGDGTQDGAEQNFCANDGTGECRQPQVSDILVGLKFTKIYMHECLDLAGITPYCCDAADKWLDDLYGNLGYYDNNMGYHQVITFNSYGIKQDTSQLFTEEEVTMILEPQEQFIVASSNLKDVDAGAARDDAFSPDISVTYTYEQLTLAYDGNKRVDANPDELAGETCALTIYWHIEVYK